jgi:hypothetical protein
MLPDPRGTSEPGEKRVGWERATCHTDQDFGFRRVYLIVKGRILS